MDTLAFDGRVAVVTGAGGGLGRAHALALAERGALVVVNDLGGAIDGSGSSDRAADSVVSEITEAGGSAVADHHSVADPEGGEAIVQTALDTFGRVDVVVNNAGILRDKTLHNLSIEEWDAVLGVHLRGAFNVTKAAWPRMREQRYGRVINTSSAAGIIGNFGQANYGAAKAGLVGFTRVLAMEGERNGITSNVIAPAARTRMTEDLLGERAELLDPALVSPLVVWLAHDTCTASGEIFSIGAGHVARMFIGESRGYTNLSLTAEAVRDNWQTICSTEGFAEPRSVADAFRLMFGEG